MSSSSAPEAPPPAARALDAAQAGERNSGWVTALWALPGSLWLAFYLIGPLVFIVLVSFWTYRLGAKSGFTTDWTLSNYGTIFHSHTYWHNLLSSLETSLIAVVACLVFGFPIAYFLALKVQSLRNQIALFVIALAPFWTSFLVRSVAWTYPLSDVLGKFGVTTPSSTSVRLAMIQLYILFMVTPLFFTLAQVDRTALEAARDLGGNWWQTFRVVILPQTLPGIVIGSIFIFVLTMGEYGTVQVISQGAVTTVGVYIQTQIVGTQYPQGAASAVLLVFILILGVFAITRFSNLREDI